MLPALEMDVAGGEGRQAEDSRLGRGVGGRVGPASLALGGPEGRRQAARVSNGSLGAIQMPAAAMAMA